MARIPIALVHPSISLPGRYEFAKHVVNLYWLATGKKANADEVRRLTFLLRENQTLLRQAWDWTRDLIKWSAYE